MCTKVGLWKWSLLLIGVVFLKEERGIMPARWIHTMGYPSHSPSNLECTGHERTSCSTSGSLQDEESCTTVCLVARTGRGTTYNQQYFTYGNGHSNHGPGFMLTLQGHSYVVTLEDGRVMRHHVELLRPH